MLRKQLEEALNGPTGYGRGFLLIGPSAMSDHYVQVGDGEITISEPDSGWWIYTWLRDRRKSDNGLALNAWRLANEKAREWGD
jgi:hypothetical protein